MVGPEIWVITDISQIIIHKPHIPLHVKTKTVLLEIARDLGPCGGLLRNHVNTGIAFFHDGVEMLEKFHGLQIFMASVNICDPLSILLSIVQIQHGGHRIHPDAVHMVFFHPIQSIGDQIIGHLRPPVIIDQGTPVRVRALPWIQMLVQTGAVKPGKPVDIPWKMGGNPVQDHSDSCLVQRIHEIHEILGRPVSGRRRIITNHLIPPGSVKGMLHHRHQLHMRISHFFDIVRNSRGKLAVIHIFSRLLIPQERPEIHLVNTDRDIPSLPLAPAAHPLAISPFIGEIPHNGSGIGAELLAEGIGIRFETENIPF